MAVSRCMEVTRRRHNCDATAFDPNTNLVFASNGEGTLTVIGRGASGAYRVRQTFKTQPR